MQEIQHLSEPLNFDTWTERASSAGKLDTNPTGGQPIDKYNKALKEIESLKQLEKEKGKLTPAKQRDLDELNSELPTLASRKGEVVLSQTAKTHLKEVYWSARSGHRRDIYSKYMENGTLGEPLSIQLISQLDDPELFEMGMPVYEKCNEGRIFGSHFQGECDIRKRPRIMDIKTCWDIFTFYPHINELVFGESESPKWIKEGDVWVLPSDNIENGDYFCQGIVYMELYGEEEFWLRYCLVNMPDELVAQQLKRMLYDFGGKEDGEDYQEACKEFIKKHKYDHLPLNTRVATFKIKRNVYKYVELCRKVEAARVYLNWYAKEMFYWENPSKRPEGVERGLVVKSLEDIVAENVFEGGYIDEQKLGVENEQVKSEFKTSEVKEVIQETLIEVINDIKLSESISISETKIEEVKSEIQENTEPEKPTESFEQTQPDESSKPDEFLQKILSLKTIEDAIEFYMEYSDKIDDTKYEKTFYEKKDSLSTPVEAPKIQKPKSPTQVAQPTKVPIPSEPEKVYTGNERYNISDGIKNLSENLDFESAKSAVLDHISSCFPTWKTFKDHKDGITVFYLANKEVIDRDSDFRAKVSELSQNECRRLNEIAKQELLKKVNGL